MKKPGGDCDLPRPATTTLPAPSTATLPPPSESSGNVITWLHNTVPLAPSNLTTVKLSPVSVVLPIAITFPAASTATTSKAPTRAVPEMFVCQAQASAHKKKRPHAQAEPVRLSIRAHIPIHRLQRAGFIAFSSAGKVGGRLET